MHWNFHPVLGSMLASQTYLEKKRKNGFELLHDAAKKLAPLLEDTCSLSFTQAADIASEIPGVGVDYSSVHVVRTILKLRQAWELDPIAFDPEAWNRNKGMNRRTTYKAFEYMAIRTQEDADLLLTAVKTSLQNAASSRTTKALINTLKSWELPCPACEEIGMLDAMGNVAGWSFPSTHRCRRREEEEEEEEEQGQEQEGGQATDCSQMGARKQRIQS